MFYQDYFQIDQGFKPCMNQASINETPDYWLKFYPHESFVSLLRELLVNLDGGGKAIWLYGPYGTGKSHAALVLQKLLMDDESRVRAFLDKRKDKIPEVLANTLWKLRASKVFTVFDSNADGLTTPAQFLMRIERTILEALREHNLTIPQLGSLDAILDRIEEEEALFFRKRDEMQGTLAHLSEDIKTAVDLRKWIGKGDAKLTSGLVSDIMAVLHARDIYPNLNAENLLKWINAVLDANGMSKLLFIWDEFSSYLVQNQSQLKTFEDMAEASQQGRFFFLPVTHMQLESYVGNNDCKRTNGRYKFCKLDMPTNTALLLAADAFQTVNADWGKERDSLWHGISTVITSYMGTKDSDCHSNPEGFKGILPIHPMAAYMLKFLSTVVGSNQRSMFDYLKGETGTSEFQKFIAEGGPDIAGKQYLTVDYLWHYFIERDDLGTGKEVTEVRIEYATKSKSLNDIERRVFKAVLLYSLLNRIYVGNAPDLIQPTIENVKRCFEGDVNVVGVEGIVKTLEQKHCFSIINGRCEMFRQVGDSADLQKQKDKITGQFNELICNQKAQPRLAQKVNQLKDKLHFEVRCSTPEKALNSCKGKLELFGGKEGREGNQMLLQFILAQDAEQQLQTSAKAEDLAKAMKDFRMLFIAVPELHFCSTDQECWNNYVENQAHVDLAVDQSTKSTYQAQLTLVEGAFLAKLVNPAQKLRIYKPNPNGEPYMEERTWATLEAYLKNYLKECFEYFLDEYSGYNTTAMKLGGSGLASYAKAGMDLSTATGQYMNLKKVFENNGITDSPQWFDENPGHPLTQLRDLCKNKLTNALNGPTGSCSIRKIYLDIQRAPFGMLNVPYTAFVMGFVMREWLHNPRQPLQWSDKVNSNNLDEAALAEMIERAIQNDGEQYKNEKLICRISREEKAFIEAAPKMFGIAKVPNATIETTLQDIAGRLEKISDKAPLWVLPEFIEEKCDPQSDQLNAIINDLCVAQAISSKGDQQERTERLKAVGSELMKTEGLAEHFNTYITPEIFQEAFRHFVDRVRPSLHNIAEQANDLTGQYCKAIKEHFVKTTGWLWKRQDVESQLEVVECQYRIIVSLQELLGQSAFLTYESAMERMNKALYEENRISLALLAFDYPILERFRQLLENYGIGEGIKELADYFGDNADTIKQLFFDFNHKIQIGCLQKHFGDQLLTIGEEGLKELYVKLPCGAKFGADEFKQSAQSAIDTYLKDSLVQQLLTLWQSKTLSASPTEWGMKHSMPSVLLFSSDAIANEVMNTLENPGSYQTSALKKAKMQLEALEIPDETTLEHCFLERVLPRKYSGLGISKEKLSAHLLVKLNDNPEKWFENPGKLAECVHGYVHSLYQSQYQGLAHDKVVKLSDTDAKKLLLKFVVENPDVGLKILE